MKLIEEIRKKLTEKSENSYQKFSSSLLPNINNVLGTRVPIVKKTANEFYKKYGEACIDLQPKKYMEETMLQGILVGLASKKSDKIFEYIKNFVPLIDNWSVCDVFCGGLKFAQNSEKVWDFIQPYLKSSKEYDIRFAFVMILSYFVNESYIDKIFPILDNFQHEGYYAKMGAAWLLSVCYVKFPEKTKKYLSKSKLDNWTYNKGIQKICESCRVNQTEKAQLKQMKRK